MQILLRELRRFASARLDGKSREGCGQTMRLCHLFVCINRLTVYGVTQRQIRESIVNNELEIFRKEKFVN